jgi:hypothetical protein
MMAIKLLHHDLCLLTEFAQNVKRIEKGHVREPDEPAYEELAEALVVDANPLLFDLADALADVIGDAAEPSDEAA